MVAAGLTVSVPTDSSMYARGFAEGASVGAEPVVAASALIDGSHLPGGSKSRRVGDRVGTCPQVFAVKGALLDVFDTSATPHGVSDGRRRRAKSKGLPTHWRG